MLPAVLRAVRFLVVVVVYLAVGCCFYMLVEEKPCESEEQLRAPEYDEASCMEPWTLVDSLYFSMVTMSTVGFGDFAPSTAASKVFTCIYILIGVTFVFTQISEALCGTVDFCERVLCGAMHRLLRRPQKVPASPTADGFPQPLGPVAYWASHLSFPLVVLVLFQFLSAAIFTACQDGLLFWDAFYHCMVTATTVGYGDVALSTQSARIWAFFHIALSVSWLAVLISEVQERKEIRRMELLQVQMAQRQLDKDLIQSLDTTGSGVDKLEFVVGMLMELGAELCGQPLTWTAVMPFVRQFEAADLDKSGRLGKEDLALMVERRRLELGAQQAEKILSRRVHAARQNRLSQRAVGIVPLAVDSVQQAPQAQGAASSQQRGGSKSAWSTPASECVLVETID
mmetsp:Transcript_60712/g.188569  ORF Transcript_60712/g.188569 Transcript_60712/m.188569 type:complete len:398 (+) Transcript_60712:123-1316(+)